MNVVPQQVDPDIKLYILKFITVNLLYISSYRFMFLIYHNFSEFLLVTYDTNISTS